MAKQKHRGMSSIRDTNLKYVTNQTWFNKQRIKALEEGGGGGGGGAFESVDVGGNVGIKVTGATTRTQIGAHTIDGQVADVNPAIGPQNTYDVIMGGYGNTIYYHDGSEGNFIGSGKNNVIEGFPGFLSIPSSFIGTGESNIIEEEAYGSFIGTGYDNVIHGGESSIIITGFSHYLEGEYGFIGSGYRNRMYRGNGSVILTGYDNIIDASAACFIGLGYINRIEDTSGYCFLGAAGKSTIFDCDNSAIVAGSTNYMGYGINMFMGIGADSSMSSANKSTIVNSYYSSIVDSEGVFIGQGTYTYITSGSNYSFVGTGSQVVVNLFENAFVGIGKEVEVNGEKSTSYNTFIGVGNNTNVFNSDNTFIGIGDSSTGNNTIQSGNNIFAGVLTGSSIEGSYIFGAVVSLYNTINNTSRSFIGTSFFGGMINSNNSAILAGDQNFISYAKNSVVSGDNNKLIGEDTVNTSSLLFGRNNKVEVYKYQGSAYPESYYGFINGYNNNIYNYGYEYGSSLNFGFIHGENNTINSNTDDNNDHITIFGYNNTVEESRNIFVAGHSNYSNGYNNVNILGNNITANRTNCTFINNLNIKDIPTSSAGLNAGDVWSNAGVLTIV